MITLIKNTIIFAILMSIFISYLLLICTALCINSFFNPSKRLEQYAVAWSKRVSYHVIVSIFGYWFPNPIFIKYNKKILEKKHSIVISNHCSDYDWLFLFAILKELQKYNNFKLLLKRELASVPLIGFVLKKFGHIFLNRQRSKDIQIIKNHLKGIEKANNLSYSVALYPEGTYMHQEAIDGAIKFAKKMNC